MLNKVVCACLPFRLAIFFFRRQERGGQENNSGQNGVNASNAENNSRLYVSNQTKLSTVKANERADEAANDTLRDPNGFR